MKEENKKKGRKPKQVSKVINTEGKTWLVQPVSITVMRHNYSVVQTRALVSIFERLQENINDVIKGKKSDQLSLFTDVDFRKEDINPNSIFIGIPINEMNVASNYYDKLKEGVISMSNINVEIPVKDQSGRKYDKYPHLFTVYWPKDNDRIVWFEFEKNIALKMVDTNSMGFTKYLKETVIGSTSRYTQRIYMYIRSWIDVGYVVISMEELREMFKLEDTEYKRFCDFNRKVLKPAYEELKEKALKGETDCYFEMEKVYTPGRVRRGTPDKIKFLIFKSEYGKLNDAVRKLNRNKIELYDILKNSFGLNTTAIKRTLEQLNDENLNDFKMEVERIANLIKENEEIENKTAYAVACLKTFFEIHNQVPEEIKIDPVNNTRNEPSAKTKPVCELTDAEMQLWDRMLNILKSKLSENEFTIWFTDVFPLKVEKTNEETRLTICVPSKFVYEMIEEKFLPVFKVALFEVFGKNTKLNYKYN